MRHLQFIFLFFMVLFMVQSCADKIISECDTSPVPTGLQATLGSIQQYVFTPTCNICHGGNFPEAGLNLSAGASYSNLVGVASVGGNLLRVEAGNSAQSWLIKKLNGDGVSVMPPTGKLSQGIIDTIAIWIDAGAVND